MSDLIAGHCPMGCGPTLFVADGGHITCSHLRCPRPTAVDDLLEDRETEHIVQFDATELAGLRAGESDQPPADGVVPTPAEWIRRWNDASPEQRLVMAQWALGNSDIATRCFVEDHVGRGEELEQLRAESADLRAAVGRDIAIIGELRQQLDDARTTRDETHVWTNTDWKERAEAAETELDRRITAEAEALADQTLMKGLTVDESGATLTAIPPREIAAIWVHCAVGMLGDAPNYSETRVDMPKVSMEISPAGSFDRYALIVQRVGKLTPHEARQQAEAANARVRAVHTEHEGRCIHCTERCDCMDEAAADDPELRDLEDLGLRWTECPHGNEPYPCPTIRALNPKEPQ